MTDETATDLRALVEHYAQSVRALKAYRDKHFKFGQLVRVDSKRYQGVGVVCMLTEDLPPDQLPVRLDNGNTWWYPLVDIVEVIQSV